MQILLTNDDGIHSEGLLLLASQLREHGYDVWIAAPDTERSAFSHAITLHHSVEFKQVEHQSFSCSGTPADCVFYGLKGAVPFTPDVIISGINRGFNIGTDIIYSGTVAAAREAALHGIPAVAVSAEGFEPPYPFEEAARFCAEHLEEFLELWESEFLININVPHGSTGRWQVGYPEHRDYGDAIEPVQVSEDIISYRVSVDPKHAHHFIPNQDSDMELLSRGIISVTPVGVHPVMIESAYRRFADLASDEKKSR
jgi:5'-nucleotidase